jgi:hypothetical protein
MVVEDDEAAGTVSPSSSSPPPAGQQRSETEDGYTAAEEEEEEDDEPKNRSTKSKSHRGDKQIAATSEDGKMGRRELADAVEVDDDDEYEWFLQGGELCDDDDAMQDYSVVEADLNLCCFDGGRRGRTSVPLCFYSIPFCLPVYVSPAFLNILSWALRSAVASTAAAAISIYASLPSRTSSGRASSPLRALRLSRRASAGEASDDVVVCSDGCGVVHCAHHGRLRVGDDARPDAHPIVGHHGVRHDRTHASAALAAAVAKLCSDLISLSSAGRSGAMVGALLSLALVAVLGPTDTWWLAIGLFCLCWVCSYPIYHPIGATPSLSPQPCAQDPP